MGVPHLPIRVGQLPLDGLEQEVAHRSRFGVELAVVVANIGEAAHACNERNRRAREAPGCEIELSVDSIGRET